MEVGEGPDKLDITAEEADRLKKAFKNEKFREMLSEYVQEISDPENRKQYEEEIKLLERQRGNTIEFIHPTPNRCLRTSVDGKVKCFINICSSEKVGKPECKGGLSEEGRRGQRWSLPHSLHPGRQDMDPKGNKISIYDVVFHPDTLHIAGKDKRFMDMVDNTAMMAIQSAFKVTLDKNNIRQMKTKYKGKPEPCVIRKPVPGYKAKEPSEGPDPLPFPFPDKKSQTAVNSSDSTPKSFLRHPEKPTEPTKPRYTVKYRSYVDLQDYRCSRDSAVSPRPKEIVVAIELPLLKSIADTNLEVKERSLLLDCKKPAYRLELPLAYAVDQDQGEAKFNKQRGQLTVTLPVLPSKEAQEFAMTVQKGSMGVEEISDVEEEKAQKEIDDDEEMMKGQINEEEHCSVDVEEQKLIKGEELERVDPDSEDGHQHRKGDEWRNQWRDGEEREDVEFVEGEEEQRSAEDEERKLRKAEELEIMNQNEDGHPCVEGEEQKQINERREGEENEEVEIANQDGEEEKHRVESTEQKCKKHEELDIVDHEGEEGKQSVAGKEQKLINQGGEDKESGELQFLDQEGRAAQQSVDAETERLRKLEEIAEQDCEEEKQSVKDEEQTWRNQKGEGKESEEVDILDKEQQSAAVEEQSLRTCEDLKPHTMVEKCVCEEAEEQMIKSQDVEERVEQEWKPHREGKESAGVEMPVDLGEEAEWKRQNRNCSQSTDEVRGGDESKQEVINDHGAKEELKKEREKLPEPEIQSSEVEDDSGETTQENIQLEPNALTQSITTGSGCTLAETEETAETEILNVSVTGVPGPGKPDGNADMDEDDLPTEQDVQGEERDGKSPTPAALRERGEDGKDEPIGDHSTPPRLVFQNDLIYTLD